MSEDTLFRPSDIGSDRSKAAARHSGRSDATRFLEIFRGRVGPSTWRNDRRRQKNPVNPPNPNCFRDL